MSDITAPVTAIVVSYNDAHLLRKCLPNLQWCDQLIVVDMVCTDDTQQVAKQYATLILKHERSTIVEPVRLFASQHATNDWLLFVDPDEEIPTALVADINHVITTNPQAGSIRLPWLFHFKDKPLEYTVWGGRQRFKRFMAHRHRCKLTSLCQRGIETLPEFEEVEIKPTANNHVRHNWIQSYPQLFEKHIRFASHEGEGLHQDGQIFSWRDLWVKPILAFKYCYITRRGCLEGWRGLVLSFVYGIYMFLSSVSLYRYQKNHKPRLSKSKPKFKKAA